MQIHRFAMGVALLGVGLLALALLTAACHRDAPPRSTAPGGGGALARQSAPAATAVSATPAEPPRQARSGASWAAELPIATPDCHPGLTGYAAPATPHRIAAARPVQPFYQWQSNNGYCGEVSLLQAGLNNGLWASQFNLRLLCGYQSQGDDGIAAGTPLLQSGPDGYCAAHRSAKGGAKAAHAAQLLLDVGDPALGEGSVLTCAANAGLAAQPYQAPAQLKGKAALKHFVSWIKQQLLAGHAVAIGVLTQEGTQTEYDHIVSVHSVGTSLSPTDPRYDDGDVLYLEDHGSYTFSDGKPASNPAIPPGAVGPGRLPHGLSTDPEGCVPYVFGVRMADLGQTRKSFDALRTGQPYAIALAGGEGEDRLANHGVAVTGPLDQDGVTLPVVVRIAGSALHGQALPRDPVAGFHYEAPYIGDDDDGEACTNDPPAAWMDLQLRAEVVGLTPGKRYVLYRYVFDRVRAAAGKPAVGAHVALAVPRAGFNAAKARATAATAFTATGPSHVETVAARSDQVVVFRAVPADAP